MRLLSSPALRCRQTAAAIAAALGARREPDRGRAGLIEIDYGAWDGLTADGVPGSAIPSCAPPGRRTPIVTRCPDGESGQDVADARSRSWLRWRQWLAADRARCAIVVAHNHVIGCGSASFSAGPCASIAIGLSAGPGRLQPDDPRRLAPGRAPPERAGGMSLGRSLASVNPYNPGSPPINRRSARFHCRSSSASSFSRSMQAKVTPKQIAANYILQMSSVELQEAIAQELDENPALEMEELPNCPICGRPVERQLLRRMHAAQERRGRRRNAHQRGRPARRRRRPGCARRTTSSIRSRGPRPASRSRTT